MNVFVQYNICLNRISSSASCRLMTLLLSSFREKNPVETIAVHGLQLLYNSNKSEKHRRGSCSENSVCVCDASDESMSLAEPIIPLRKVRTLDDHQNMRSVTLLSRRSLTFQHFVCDKRYCHYRRHFQQKNLTRNCLTRAQANAHTLLVCKY